MGMVAKLRDDLKAAMRSRDELATSTVRLLLSALQYERIELGQDLSDDDEIRVLTKQAKQRRDSIEQFRAAGRPLLVDKEAAELRIIQGYLADIMPAQMSRDDIVAEAQAMIAFVGAASSRDMGKVMGPLMAKLSDRADGGIIREVVTSLLAAGR